MAYHSCMGDKICLLMTSAPKVAQKYPQQFCVKSKIFRHGPKVSLNILTLFVTRFVHTTFKNCPIWSRCFSGNWNYTNSLLEQLWTLSLHHFLILLNENETGNYSRVERRRDEQCECDQWSLSGRSLSGRLHLVSSKREFAQIDESK